MLPLLETSINGLGHSELYVLLQAGRAGIASVTSDSMSCGEAFGT